MAEGVEYRYDQDNNTKITRLHDDYTTGRATNLDNLDAAVSSRATQASVDTIDGIVDDILLDTAQIDSRVDQSLSQTEDNIRGASNRDLTEVYDAVTSGSNPFKLTTYSTVSGAVENFIASTWVDVYSSGALAKDTEITGVKIDTVGSVTDPVWRITLTDGTTKIFPYAASINVRDNKLEEFQFPVRVPDGQGYKIQVNCSATSGGTAQLVEADIISHG